ncbi:MAG: CpsD/CapB family tyrosine-protein kinase [Bacteroidales bacterium]|nr:CpsD/CapB family tyrosine-protein kinase [Bacteroidales bacterium]
MYDYIIIDSAPAGILTETHLLMKLADVNIYVVRVDYTVKEAFKNSLKTLMNNNFTNLALLINDVNVKRDAYKYGYDTKYYLDDRKQGILARMFNGKRKAS